MSRETVAVYEERPVRTYGIAARGELMLWLARCREGDPAPARALAACRPAPPLWVLAARPAGEDCRLAFCLPADRVEEFAALAAAAGLGALGAPRPACLIHLQGPHFGDRYGILAEALEGLAGQGVRPLFVQAAVHSIYILVAPGQARAALAGLAGRFTAPG